MGRIYIGKAEDDLIRTAQYVLRYQHTSDEDSSLLYRHCKAANRVFHFPLVESAEDDSSSRALGEALWCAVLGTYQLKDDYLAIRRDYGLANVGEEVIGTNCKCSVCKYTGEYEANSGTASQQRHAWTSLPGGPRHLKAKAESSTEDILPSSDSFVWRLIAWPLPSSTEKNPQRQPARHRCCSFKKH